VDEFLTLDDAIFYLGLLCAGGLAWGVFWLLDKTADWERRK
jgi:hypothetical protein